MIAVVFIVVVLIAVCTLRAYMSQSTIAIGQLYLLDHLLLDHLAL